MARNSLISKALKRLCCSKGGKKNSQADNAVILKKHGYLAASLLVGGNGHKKIQNLKRSARKPSITDLPLCNINEPGMLVQLRRQLGCVKTLTSARIVLLSRVPEAVTSPLLRMAASR